MAFDPDEQLNDWYGWLTTQAGHSALVGLPGALILVPWFGPYLPPVIIALAYLVIWEGAVQRFGAGIADALTDAACVMAGASILCGALIGYGTALACFAAWALLLTFGVWRRI